MIFSISVTYSNFQNLSLGYMRVMDLGIEFLNIFTEG